MSDRTLRLLLIDPDDIFRRGLRVVIEQFSDLQVVAEAETSAAALQILAESTNSTGSNGSTELIVDLVVLELALGNSSSSYLLGLQLCQQLKTQYPNLAVLLLSSRLEPSQLTVAKAMGIDGYCRKGISILELVAAIRQVSARQSYWVQIPEESPLPLTASIFATLRNHLRISGLQQIDAALAAVTTQLQPGLSVLERALLAGQRRELLASRWLVSQLLPRSSYTFPAPQVPQMEVAQPNSHSLQADLFDLTLTKLQCSLQNLTDVPLEIDIFRADKKRELLALVLRKIQDTLEALRSAQVQQHQLLEMQSVIVQDLWQAVTTDFFGKYSRLQVGARKLEVVNLLLQDALVVETAILQKIPLTADLFAYLLFQTPLMVDNVSYPPDSPEAQKRAEWLLQNLLIQIANAVVQPLVDKIGDVEAIKQSFYDSRLISTREIERFRNNLSWKYRLHKYVGEPKEIFESRYELFMFVSRGITKISIYAPRNQELAKLSRIQLVVTLVLEAGDALAPRLRSVISFLGTSIVYILTQVLGRAIGLIGRGILQGLGNSMSDHKIGRNSEKQK